MEAIFVITKGFIVGGDTGVASKSYIFSTDLYGILGVVWKEIKRLRSRVTTIKNLKSKVDLNFIT
jgi:hypothetical protein